MTVSVLLVGCGEPSIAADTDAFARALAPAHVERVLMPGGCWWLAEAASATTGKFRRAILGEHIPVRDALIRFIDEAGVERVVLLAHQGCTWYGRHHPEATQGELIKYAGADMFAARDEIARIGPEGLNIEGYVYIASSELPGFRRLFPSEPST